MYHEPFKDTCMESEIVIFFWRNYSRENPYCVKFFY
jgi:hypothetical protein